MAAILVNCVSAVITYLQSHGLSIVLLVVGISLLFIRYASRPRYNLPRGPVPLPFLGNLLAFKGRNIHEVLWEMSKTHGPVISVNMGPIHMVAIHDYEIFKDVFVKRGEEFAGRLLLRSGKILTQGFSDLAFHDYDEEYKVLLRIVVAAVREYTSGEGFVKHMQSSSMQIMDMIGRESGKAVSPHGYFNAFVFDALTSAVLNTNFDVSSNELQEFTAKFTEFSDTFEKGFVSDVWPFFKFLELGKIQRFEQLLEDLHTNCLYQYLQQHENSHDCDNHRDILDSVLCEMNKLKASGREESKWLKREHKAQVIQDILFAGTDTTRCALYWWTLYMAGHPTIQDKAYKEIAECIGDKIPGAKDRKNLPYVDACIQETLRLSPSTPLLLPHKAMKDTTIGHFDIPAGTVVVANAWAIHRDPKLWEDPLKYDPDRFIKKTDCTEAVIAFGSGKRTCLGQNIARTEILIFVTMILQRFSIHMPEGTKPDYKEKNSLLFYQAKPYEVIFKPRQSTV